jgi:hypothetical protein
MLAGAADRSAPTSVQNDLRHTEGGAGYELWVLTPHIARIIIYSFVYASVPDSKFVRPSRPLRGASGRGVGMKYAELQNQDTRSTR